MKTDGDTPEQSDDDLRQIIAELAERNKELHCLFTISRIIEQQHHSLEKTLQEVVDILPLAWQDPQIYNLCAPAESTQALRAAGLDLLSLANNHSSEQDESRH